MQNQHDDEGCDETPDITPGTATNIASNRKFPNDDNDACPVLVPSSKHCEKLDSDYEIEDPEAYARIKEELKDYIMPENQKKYRRKFVEKREMKLASKVQEKAGEITE